jgi:tRNA-2-methylthio-N6-dimethylallyladenosine synthase
MSNKYFIRTFGCQQNKSDSERIAGDYSARGWTETEDWHKANHIVINTCAVRQSAEDRVRGFLLNIEKYFEGNARPKIILTGCMTHHADSELYKLLPIVDQILPINEVGFNKTTIRKDKTHAWVTISEGCNSFCTYCIVPYSRGRETSRPLAEILSEVEGLVSDGYTEITLLGQNVNSWGLEKVGIGLRKLLMSREVPLSKNDLPTPQSQYKRPKGTPPFVALLQEVSKFEEIKMIRFMTSNPWDFHDELITEIATNKKIDRFVHLPIQSGSNRILKLMNRGYTAESYMAVINKLRKQVKDITIGTDIIVGFPGETEEDFQATLKLAKEVDWKVAFVARYSPRPGTAGWRLFEDDISPAEKKRRWEILDALINKSNLDVRPKVIK